MRMRYVIAARLLPYRRRADLQSEWSAPQAGAEQVGSTAVGGCTKPCFDIGAAATAILFLLPLFCLIALAIKLMDPGPVLYRHRRIGKGGVPFDCLKFRTMVVDADRILRRHLAANREAAREWETKQKLIDD